MRGLVLPPHLCASTSVRSRTFMSNSRFRNFVFTINNWEEDDISRLMSLDPKYLVYGKEKGENGTPHLQGYMELPKPVSFQTVQKTLKKRAHIESRKGTALEAATYCKKDGEFIEVGTISNPGKRSDLLSFVAAAKEERPTKKRLIEEFTSTYARYPRFCESVISTYHPPPSMQVLDFYWFHGETGTGKSRTAREENPGAYIKNLNKWWDNYDNEDCIIIDEWHPELENSLGPHLKRWADHYPFQAEVKGGTMFIRPKKIIVTSNYTLFECFLQPQNYRPLERRFIERAFFSQNKIYSD